MTRARILIVEDDMLIVWDLRTTLEDLGYEVTSTVSTGEEGLEEIECSEVDLVIMDVRLAGELDGIETARLIQLRFEIPVVFITGASEIDLDRFNQLIGSWKYVAKPFHEERLRAAIDTALRPKK